MTPQQRLAEAIRLLKRHYGAPAAPLREEPLDALVATILSQNTSGANSSRAFARLKRRFPHWEDALRAPLAEIEDAIRPAGLVRQKAPRIREVLLGVLRERGELTLDFLNDRDDRAATAWLQSLPGVGPKTAACVLLFALGRAVFPVDTHVHRIALRLELAPQRTPPGSLQEVLREMSRPEDRFAGHVLMVRLGRELCRPRSPRCGACPLRKICPSASCQTDLIGA